MVHLYLVFLLSLSDLVGLALLSHLVDLGLLSVPGGLSLHSHLEGLNPQGQVVLMLKDKENCRYIFTKFLFCVSIMILMLAHYHHGDQLLLKR